MRIINVPPGIGDSIWILQKLINANEKFIFKIPGAPPQRGKQLYDLLPMVSESASYAHYEPAVVENRRVIKKAVGLSFRDVKNENLGSLKWSQIDRKEIYLEANTHLEQGKRIEKFLPDIPTSYTLPYQTEHKAKAAEKILKGKGKLIGIYCSTYSGSQNWGSDQMAEETRAWGIDKWFQFVELMHKEYEATFVIIGAEYDNLTISLYWKLHENKIPAINTVGQDLATVIEILKRLDYFIGFPSGLSIINETLGKDGVMFLANVTQHVGVTRHGVTTGGLINKWADPERIKNGNIKECLFCSPEKIFDWIKNDYKLFK